MFGFEVDFWDCATFVAIFVCVLLGLTFIVWLAGLPGYSWLNWVYPIPF